ncbi:hypothetical protein SETIT_9G258200v2 [Setaria italica]|uniref:Uncharacterized protein n=3 Tax=Setaria TaxID=4554 RepID=A0A368SKQ1_SETIT|nr:hypothetical protein SETIT_9G258200v2 [Setaria italica]
MHHLLGHSTPPHAFNTGSRSKKTAPQSASASASPSPTPSGRGSSVPMEAANVDTIGSGVGAQAPHVQTDETTAIIANPEVVQIHVEGDDEDQEEGDDVVHLTGKRKRRCTSAVWEHFTKLEKSERQIDWIEEKNEEQIDSIQEEKEEEDMDSDPDIMDDADEL